MRIISIIYCNEGEPVSDFEIDKDIDEILYPTYEQNEFMFSTLLIVDELRARIAEDSIPSDITFKFFFEFDNEEIKEIIIDDKGLIISDLRGCSIINQTANRVGRILRNQKKKRVTKNGI